MTKKILSIILSLLIIVPLCACEDRVDTDDYAYVIAIGVDEGEDKDIKITFSFANSIKIGGGSSGGGGGEEGEEGNLINFTISSTSMFTGLDILRNNISKKVNLSHVKLIVFSKDIAKKGLSEYTDGFIREFKIRPITFMAVAEKSSEDYLNALSPLMAVNPEKYIKNLYSRGKSDFGAKIDIYTFYINSQVDDKDVVLPMVGVISEKEDKNEVTNEKIKSDSMDISAIPLKSKNKATIIGNAIFKGDKMVDAGENSEQLFLNILRGVAGTFDYTVGKDSPDQIVLTIIQRHKPKVYADVSGASPKISTIIPLECEITSLGEGKLSEKDYKKIQKMLSSELEADLKKYFYKISREAECDAVGYGRYAKMSFDNWETWKNYDWQKRIPYIQYDVKVQGEILKFGIIDEGYKP